MTLPCDQLRCMSTASSPTTSSRRSTSIFPACASCRAELHQALQLRALEIQARTVARRDRLRPKVNVWVPVAFALAAAAAVVIWLGVRPADRPEAPVELALAAARPIEGRISHPAADRHRPYDVARSGATGDVGCDPAGHAGGAGEARRPPRRGRRVPAHGRPGAGGGVSGSLPRRARTSPPTGR